MKTQDSGNWEPTLEKSAGRGRRKEVVGLWFGGASGKEPACKCRRHERHGFDPWGRKFPWRKKWQPAPVFSPGEFHGQRSPGRLQSMQSRGVGHDGAEHRGQIGQTESASN